jgi:hypothetical protein
VKFKRRAFTLRARFRRLAAKLMKCPEQFREKISENLNRREIIALVAKQ